MIVLLYIGTSISYIYNYIIIYKLILYTRMHLSKVYIIFIIVYNYSYIALAKSLNDSFI